MNTPSTRENSLRVAVLVCGIDIALTGYAAWSSNSVTILGSLVKELADFIAMLSAFATFRAVRREPNERFAYGVGKLENLVSVGTGILMFGCSFGILYQAIGAIQDPRPTEGTLPGIMLFSIYSLIGFWLWQRNLRAVRQQSSAILLSQAHLWFSKALYDGLMAVALILALIFKNFAWSAFLDPLASLVGVGFLLLGAWSMASSSVGDLLDSTLEEATKLRIMRHMVEHFVDYSHLYQIRTRRAGPRVYVEVFLQFDPELRMSDVERRIEVLRAEIATSIPGADITICPVMPSAQPAS